MVIELVWYRIDAEEKQARSLQNRRDRRCMFRKKLAQPLAPQGSYHKPGMIKTGTARTLKSLRVSGSP